MDLYPTMIAAGTLTRDDTRRIGQTLHACLRNSQLLSGTRTDLLSFLQQLIEDLQKGALPSHPFVFVHILGIYRERKLYDEGYALWQWLVQQDDTHVSQAVYGAAIEMMAYGKKLRLYELENLYVDALKRFPGTFAEYHLSPDAIVPDRSQPIVIAGVPITLLQGILTARLLHNDWKNAYLALDTALRLYPCQLPSRFFEMFMEKRPLGEAYTTFLVACRAGNVLRPSHVTSLLSKIRNSIEPCDALGDRIVLVRAIANALYAYLEAGGSLDPIHVGQFLISFGSLLPQPAPGNDYQGDLASLRNRIITFAHGTLSSLFQAGMPPSSNVLIALVFLAGRLRVPDLLRVSLQDAETAQVDLGDIGTRGVMTSAGQTGAKDVIEETWTRIAHKAASNGRQIEWKDWVSFAKACKRADHVDYFRNQLQEQEHAIPASYKDLIMVALDEEMPHFERTMDISRSEEFENELGELNQQIKNISAVVMSGQRLDIRNTPFYMFLDPKKPPLARLEDMQKVYNEYTIDPHQPPPENSAVPAALSPTGLPLDELRFANWVSIVELMDQAHRSIHDRLDNLKRFGEDIALKEKRYPLNRKSPRLLALPYLKEHVKNLRDISVGQSATRKSYTPKLITPSPPNDARSIKDASNSETKPPRFPKPLRIIKHARGSSYRQIDISPDAQFPDSSQTISSRPPTNNLQVLYHMFPSGGKILKPAAASSEADASESDAAAASNNILPGLPRNPAFKAPSIKKYVSIKATHEAPAPKPRISRHPLGRRKHVNNHSFRNYREDQKEGGRGSEEGEWRGWRWGDVGE
ncbi:hypothetical protein SLS60_009819 [Paraconiothyrium brasiliense]|uniref:Uncharacterized protein n=1 Tax=Paraconiothyrium brasiliense TaxID=300254 RepID=A0ABR3QSJ7_9PLEO